MAKRGVAGDESAYLMFFMSPWKMNDVGWRDARSDAFAEVV